jgi:transcriptional regulator with XRE-family HTH domain
MKLGDLARKSRISIAFMSLLESGGRQPSLAVIRRIAAALDIPSEALVLAGMGVQSKLHTWDRETAGITRAIDDLIHVESKLKRLLGSAETEVHQKRNSDAQRKRHHSKRGGRSN